MRICESRVNSNVQSNSFSCYIDGSWWSGNTLSFLTPSPIPFWNLTHGYRFPVFSDQEIRFRRCLLTRGHLNEKITLLNFLSYISLGYYVHGAFYLGLLLESGIEIPFSACVCINKPRFAPGLCLHCHVCRRQCKQNWVEPGLVLTWGEPRLVGVV